jgi:hypothetical protein
MKNAKGAWQVTAGIIPGKPIPVYSLTLHYSSEDYDLDRALSQGETTTFCRLRDQALDHAKQVMHPAATNWVRIEWVWY